MSKDRLDFVFPTESNAASWAERHERGEVPSRWPYGLENLAGGSVGLRELARPGRMARLLSRIADARGNRRGLTWDENTAVRMVQSRQYRHMHSGVIWATPSSMSRTQRWALKRLESIWVLSSAQVEPLRDALSIPVHHVLFGVDTEFFQPGPYPEDDLVISLGNDRHRDAVMTAKAFSLVMDARPHVKTLIQSRKDIEVDPRTRFVRSMPHDELRNLYQEASVVTLGTLPNDHVSGMTVALEASATARPVVATATPGFEDYLLDDATGVLVRSHSSRAIADAIIDLVDSRSRAAAMGSEGRRLVEDRFTTKHLCDRITHLVLGEKVNR